MAGRSTRQASSNTRSTVGRVLRVSLKGQETGTWRCEVGHHWGWRGTHDEHPTQLTSEEKETRRGSNSISKIGRRTMLGGRSLEDRHPRPKISQRE